MILQNYFHLRIKKSLDNSPIFLFSFPSTNLNPASMTTFVNILIKFPFKKGLFVINGWRDKIINKRKYNKNTYTVPFKLPLSWLWLRNKSAPMKRNSTKISQFSTMSSWTFELVGRLKALIIRIKEKKKKIIFLESYSLVLCVVFLFLLSCLKWY